MTTGLFEITGDRSSSMGGFVRKYTLCDLAETLVETLGFGFDHWFGFCDNIPRTAKSKAAGHSCTRLSAGAGQHSQSSKDQVLAF